MEEPHEAKVARAMARVHTSSRPTLDAAADFILNEMYVEVTGSGVNAIEWSLVRGSGWEREGVKRLCRAGLCA